MLPSETISVFEQRGFATIPSVVDTTQVQDLLRAVEAVRTSATSPGLRNLLGRSAFIQNFATNSAISQIAEKILSAPPLPVRAILFDKTPESNWYVTWHQDLTIPVRERFDVEEFGSWSVKDGILHCQPPARILEQMVSLRLHLDDCNQSNGPIKFIAGSHRFGILSQELIAERRDRSEHEICCASQTDVIAMRPLTLHSSSVATAAEHRRVLHLEYAGTPLPAPLAWAQA